MENGALQKSRMVAMGLVAFAAIFLVVGGTALGFWVGQNFELVPKGAVNQAVQETLAEGGTVEDMLAKAGVEGVDPATLDAMLKQAGLGSVEEVNQRLQQNQAPVAATTPEPAVTPRTGPFAVKFTEGEALQYRMQAAVDGEGLELMGAAPIDLDMDSGFTLETKSVAPDGTGSLELKFGQTQMSGDFMGSNFQMREGPGGSVVEMNGQRMVDTAKGVGSTAGLPQMEFFKGAVQMQVGPDGVVRHVVGQDGMEDFVKQLPLFTNMEFPEGEVEPGRQWKSRLAMQVPGFGAPVEAEVTNTFTGYQQVGDKLCAVVEQKVESSDSANMLSSPESVLGAAMGFSMPQFELNGKNLVYIDSANGQMVHTDMDLDLKMDIGKALGGSADVLGEVGKGLTDLLGDLPEFEGLLPDTQAGEKNLLDLNLDLKARVSLVDPATGKTAEEAVEQLAPEAEEREQVFEWAEPAPGAAAPVEDATAKAEKTALVG